LVTKPTWKWQETEKPLAGPMEALASSLLLHPSHSGRDVYSKMSFIVKVLTGTILLSVTQI